MIDVIGRVVEIDDRQMLYDTVLYVDANTDLGDDANNGSKSSPYLTITAAVAAAAEYTTIICSDSRVGAAAVGFDEDTAVTGVTIAKNHITIMGGCPGQNCGHKVSVGNTIANADNVFNVTGDCVALVGLAMYLQDVNGDEVAVLSVGDCFRMEYCDIPADIPANAQNECIRITGNHFVLNRVHTVNSDVGLRCTGSVQIGRVRNCTFQQATEDGVLLETGTIDVYVESCQFQACGDAIDIDAGATYNAFYECNFANNTNIWVNGGGATNQLINAKEESELTAGNTSEDDHKEIYDKVDAIPTTAMRGTENAALAATALSDAVWTNAKAAFLTQDITVGIKKNVQRTIVFKMVDATDFATPETGITVIEEISKDGGAFAACANAFSEIANGWYKITLTATEMNASEIIFKGTSAGCAQCDRLIVTES